MKAELEYRAWMAILEPPANLVAELHVELSAGGALPVPPLSPFGAALIASGSGELPRKAFHDAAALARAHAEALRFGPPEWIGRFLLLQPDEPTALLLAGLAACFPPGTGGDGCAGLAAGEAGTDAASGAARYGMVPLVFRTFRLSLWRAARVEAPASGWLLDPAADAWIRVRERAGRAGRA